MDKTKIPISIDIGFANSRYKDFYDIYILATNYDFEGNDLQKTLIETFNHRKTGFDDIVAFDEEFANDTRRKNSWESFVNKKKATIKVDFVEVLDIIRKFLSPLVEGILNNRISEKLWKYDERNWI